MNLSKLTNPEDNELGITSSTDILLHVPPEERDTNPDINAGIDSSDSANESEDAKEDGGEVDYGEEDDEKSEGTGATPVRQRSTSEYRTLYNYLLEKFKNANYIAKVLDEFDVYLKNLSKYQQLRNNMLVDILQYLNQHESLTPIDPLNHEEIMERLENIRTDDPSVNSFLATMMELESVETEDDPKTNLNAFNKVIGINDSLSADLAIQETNFFPDLYIGSFDSFELVKKNKCFENKIGTLLDLRTQIQTATESKNTVEVDHSTTKRRRTVSTASKTNDSMTAINEDADHRSSKKSKA